MTHHTDTAPSQTLARSKRLLWRPPRAHGDTILNRRVSPPESPYDPV